MSGLVCFQNLVLILDFKEVELSSVHFRKQNKPQICIYFYSSKCPIKDMVEAKAL